jgi:class 3 adenylate cyclase
MQLSAETTALFAVLRESATPDATRAIERLVAEGPDAQLCRINALHFAEANGLGEEDAIAAFLHAARLGLFELSWNVLCPGCGGVLQAGTSLKAVHQAGYHCALCAAGYEPTLDEMVEVTFTISPRIRKIAAHDPDSLSWLDYHKQMFWSSGTALPDDAALERLMAKIMLETIELQPQEKAVLSLQLPAAFVIVFDPVVHMAQFLDVQGEPTRERQSLSFALDREHVPAGTLKMSPGPVRIALDNRTDARTLPGIWIAGDELHHLVGSRRPFVTAKRLLSNQTFRDIYRTDTLNVDQRLKITSLTFVFTDLKGSTELYERVGDLAAYDLVRAHFGLLHEIAAAEGGAIVKTIGDAVMATFPTPDRAVAAALRMREAIRGLREDLLVKIGIHEGPCLAVMLNERQDYFGQTVNIASRVQGLCQSRSIFATGQVVHDGKASHVLRSRGIMPSPCERPLRGITSSVEIFEIP